MSVEEDKSHGGGPVREPDGQGHVPSQGTVLCTSGTSGELQNSLGYHVFTQAHAQISILRGLKVRGQVTTVDEIRAPPSSSARSDAA